MTLIKRNRAANKCVSVSCLSVYVLEYSQECVRVRVRVRVCWP